MLSRLPRALMRCIAAISLGLSLSAHADSYPSRQIEFVVPYGAGGSTDAYARLVAPKLSALLKVPVVVVNRAGAAGAIGGGYAFATSDGYRILAGGSSNLGAALAAGPKPTYTIDDVAGVAQVLVNPITLISKKGRFASFDAFLKEARDKPQTLTIGTWGLRTLGHFYLEQFAQTLNIELRHIPYDSGAKAMLAAMSGEIDGAFVTAATAKTNILAGNLTGILVSTEQKLPDLPSVESIKVLGFPGAVAYATEGVSTNAKVPAERIAVLRKAFDQVLADPQVMASIRAGGSEPAYLPGVQYDQRLRSELAQLRQVASKVKMDD